MNYEFEYEGVTYKTQPYTGNDEGCDGCAFDCWEKMKACEESALLFPCTTRGFIIWIKKEIK